MIPKPRSNFVKVECEKCNTTRVLYTYSTKPIFCSSCNSGLLINTGGQAEIVGKILETLD